VTDSGECKRSISGALWRQRISIWGFGQIIKGDIKKTDKSEEILPQTSSIAFTFAEPIAYYLDVMKGRPDFKNIQTYVTELLDYFGAKTPMSAIEDKIPDYIEWSKKQKVKTYVGKDEAGNKLYKEQNRLRSPNTINAYLQIIVRTFKSFKSAQINKKYKQFIPDPPEFDYLPVPKRTPTPVPQEATKAYMEAIDDTLHRHIRLAYILCIQTGMREKELAKVKDRQYIESERVILLTPEQTKTSTGRFVHINDIAHSAILECRKIGNLPWMELQSNPELAAKYKEKYNIVQRGDINLILYRKGGTGVPRPVKHIASCQVPQDHIPRKSYALFESRAILKEVFANLRASS
jgi:integrase